MSNFSEPIIKPTIRIVTDQTPLASYPGKVGRVSVERMEGIDIDGNPWTWVQKTVYGEALVEEVTEYAWTQVGGNDGR